MTPQGSGTATSTFSIQMARSPSDSRAIGNFGDGRIGAYDPSTGTFIDFVRDGDGNPTVINGLWGLALAPGADSAAVFFTSRPNGEAHGLLGTLKAN